MIERVLTEQRLRLDFFVVAWGIIVALSGKAAAMIGSVAIVFGWEVIFLFLIPLLSPVRFLLATIISVAIFFDVSLWFLQGDFSTNTIYESRGADLKPSEFLILALAIRILLLKNLLKTIPRSFIFIVAAWVSVILLGVFTAMRLSRPLSDILTYSEVRSPIVMAFFAIALSPLIRFSPKFFIDLFAIFISVHFLISLISWLTGVSILWQSYAPDYVGGHTAFFGADESVMVYVLAFTFALSIIISSPDKNITGLSRNTWIFVFCATAFAIIASLRRGGIGALAIIILFLFIFARSKSKMRFLSAAIILIPVLLFIATQLGLIDAFATRLLNDEQAKMSNAGHLSDVLESSAYAAQHFWTGTGAGTRLAMTRTKAYGVAETLSIHNSVLHVWVRYGFLGAAPYFLLFFAPIFSATVFAMKGGRLKLTSIERNLLIALSGLLFAVFAWTLSTPAIFINFRQCAIWFISVAMIYAIISTVRTRIETSVSAPL